MTSLVLRALSVSCISATLAAGISIAQVPDSYSGMTPRMGDVHQHTLSPQDARELATAVPKSPGYCTGSVGERHEFGSPPLVLDAERAAGYDWTNLSPHMVAGMTESQTDTPYVWWSNPTSTPVIVPGDPSAIPDVYFVPGSNPPVHWVIRRSSQGYPFYKANDPNFQNLGGLSTPWSYWLSNGSAADSRTVNGSYVGFAGTEWTTYSFFTSGGYAGGSGHRLVVMPNTVRGCSVDANGNSAAANCDDEWELDRWLVQNGGLIVQAHPAGPPWVGPLHPKNSPSGFSDSVVMGVEVGGGFQGFVGSFYETSMRRLTTAGYRVFPAFGGDLHQQNDPYCNDWPVATEGPKLGGTVCWASTFDRVGIVGAMKARRCYFSNGYKPTLKLEACSNATCSAGVAKMGDQLALSGTTVYVRLSATNDLPNQEPNTPYPKRFDRFEIVHQNGSLLYGASCTRGTNGGGVTPAVADSCSLPFTAVTLPSTSGSFYARVCTLLPGKTACTDDGVYDPVNRPNSTPNMLVSSPIFVNWDQYKATTGTGYCDFDATTIPCGVPGCLPAAVDSDQDGYPNTCDTCPSIYDPNQPDFDKSGIGDLCNSAADPDGDEVENGFDNCPTVANPSQTDTDHSGVGDACNDAFDADGDEFENGLDNCPNVANPTQADLDADHVGDACDPDVDGDGAANGADNCPNVANPDQLDTDGDGIGDACDNCKLVPNPDQADTDVDFNYTQGVFLHPDGVGDACDNCVHIYNPIPATAPPANRTTTGGQFDDDADGYGNACDLDYDNDGVVNSLPDPNWGTCGEDADYYQWSSPNYPLATASTCGASGNLRCELFDMNGDGVVGGTDDFLYIALTNNNFGGPVPLGPKCPTCPLACVGDACSGQPDSDGDGRPDAFDNCPTIANANQADADGDHVGDLCDNCTNVSNRRVPIGCVVSLGWMTTTGGQRDDDHDGYGNVCDAKFTTLGINVGSSDLGQFRASQGKDRTIDTCGTAGNRPCAIFDLDEVNDTVDDADLNVFRALNGKLPGPKCTACPLTCATGANGTCN